VIAPLKPIKRPLKKVPVEVTVHADGKISHKVLNKPPAKKKPQ
jgi:hypothetical protein